MTWKVIIVIVILAFVLFPKSLSSRINLNNLPKNNLTIEVIHRNNILEGGTITSTTDITKIEELENFLKQYKNIPVLLLKNKLEEKLDDEESYVINFKNGKEFLTTIVLYKKNFEIIPGKVKNLKFFSMYNVIGENIDFNFLEQFVKSMN
ncbi:hypothetical protein [Clostridium sp. CCUG 7971]|uniref:hypothetical protein n=1 Tax=Clostridium sp. CCUG 7971 TaxID=2811414 RepID=UPI001ABB2434|nr:hypothetical protein [Clostridium sp. CCUG 7971]MBO3446498.1 hypothetical protein [Clostridium sp. CCUG 7971]